MKREPQPKVVPYGGRAQQLKAQGKSDAQIMRLAKTGAARIVVPDKRGSK